MSEHDGVAKPAEKPVDPLVCRTKHDAVDAFTNSKSAYKLHVIEVAVGGEEPSTWHVSAPGPVAAREAVLKVGSARRVSDDELWGWVKDELAAMKQQVQDSLEGGTGCTVEHEESNGTAKEHCDAG